MSGVIDISPDNLDSSLSHDVQCIYVKGDNIQP